MGLNFLKERANTGYASGASGRPYTFKLEDTGKRYHIGFLHPFNSEIRIHYKKGSAPIFCNKLYYTDEEVKEAKKNKVVLCEECNQDSETYAGKKNTPQCIMLALGYVVEHATPIGGQPVKGKKASGGEFEESPIKIIAVPAGKGRINLKGLEEGIGDGDFMDKFWKFEKDASAGYLAPAPVDIKKLGKDFDMEAFKAVKAEYAKKSDAEIFSICLSGYANVKWEHPDFVANGLVNPFPDDSPSTGESQATVDNSDLDKANID